MFLFLFVNFFLVFLMGPNPSIQKLPSSEKSLNLADKKLECIPIIFSKKSKLSILILNYNLIRELPKNLKHLTSLSMTHNELTEINEDMLAGLISYPSIESLDFSYNKLAAFPAAGCSQKTLKTLNLFKNKITELDCSQATELTSVDVGQNQLTEMPLMPDSVVTISMDCNQISEINTAFSKLSRLCATLNKISSIKPDLVFPVLTTLDLSRNCLKSLPDLVEFAPHLRQLDVSDNQISEVSAFPRTITEIYFQFNCLTEFPSNFSNLTCLQIADFSYNKIVNVPSLPTSIQTLMLHGNQIETAANSQTPDLLRLYFMNNNLKQIPPYRGSYLNEYFLLSNHITTITLENFSKFIQRIDLTDNEIENIPSELFALPQLFYLTLTHNKIKKMPITITKVPLIYLNISENPIEELPELLPRTLEQFVCAKCGIKKLPDSLSVLEDLIEVIAPFNDLDAVPRLPVVENLDLSHNHLKELPQMPDTVIFLDLSFNEIETIPEDWNMFYWKPKPRSYPVLLRQVSQDQYIATTPIENQSPPPANDAPEPDDESSHDDDNEMTIRRNSDDTSDGDLEENDIRSVQFTEHDFQEEDSDDQIEVDPNAPKMPHIKEIDISYNKLHEFPTNIELPTLRKLQLSHNPQLKLTIDPKLYESLEYLDLSYTSSVVNGKLEVTLYIPSSSEEVSLPFIRHLRSDENVAFTTYKGENDTFEDVLITKTEETPFYGIFCSYNDHQIAEIASNEFISKIKKLDSTFDKKSMQRLFRRLHKALRSHKALNEFAYGVVMENQDKYLVGSIGNVQVVRIKHDRTFSYISSKRYSNEMSRISGNRTHNQIGASRELGDFVVFEMRKKASIKLLNRRNKDKWIIMATSCVFDAIPQDRIVELAMSSPNAIYLASALKQSALARSCNSNISVIVLDIHPGIEINTIDENVNVYTSDQTDDTDKYEQSESYDNPSDTGSVLAHTPQDTEVIEQYQAHLQEHIEKVIAKERNKISSSSSTYKSSDEASDDEKNKPEPKEEGSPKNDEETETKKASASSSSSSSRHSTNSASEEKDQSNSKSGSSSSSSSSSEKASEEKSQSEESQSGSDANKGSADSDSNN